MTDLRSRALALIEQQTPCTHGVEHYLRRGALSVCPLCRYIVDDSAWHGTADSARHAPRELAQPISEARREALQREASEASKASEARKRRERKASERKRAAALASMTPAQREASEREHKRERDNAKVAREARKARASAAPVGTTSTPAPAPSALPYMTRVDSASERRTRDALPDSLDHGVGWHGEAPRVTARFALIPNRQDTSEASAALVSAISESGWGGLPRNLRNRRARARKALARAQRNGAPVGEAVASLARASAGSVVFTSNTLADSNASEARLSARQQAPARRYNAAPVASAASEAPAPTGAGWALQHATD